MQNLASFLCIIMLLMTASLLAPRPAGADMEPLGEADMESISAQAGIAVYTEGSELDMSADIIALGSPAEAKSQVFMSLCGVVMQGSIHMKHPLKITTAMGPNAFTDQAVSIVNLRMNGLVMKTDRFIVDAIRVGSQPGKGPSFGSLYIKGMHTEISGNISIWAL